MEGQKKDNPWIFSFFEDALTDYDDGAFITETVRNLLEDGYDSAGLKALKESSIPVPATRFEGLLLKRNIGVNREIFYFLLSNLDLMPYIFKRLCS